MKYFHLEHEIRKEVIGPYPQSEGMADHYHYKRADSIRFLNYDNDFIPNLDAIQLSRGVKLTDLLSVVVIGSLAGKIISADFKTLLADFHLPPHRFFEAKVINSQQQLIQEKQYFLFRVLSHQNQYIDFDKSEFYIHRRGLGEIGSIHIQCAEDLEYSSRERGLGVGQFVQPRFITLFPEIDFDIFSFRRFAGFFVSERLKTAIEDSDLTGIRFELADFIVQKEVAMSRVKNE